MKRFIIIMLSALVTCSNGNPWPGSQAGPPSFIKYDQRQEGDWNVRADLENFVILVIPASPSAAVASTPSMSGTLSLLDLLTKAVPWRGIKRKRTKKPYQQHADNMQELPLDTQQFIESKTAPYHVDISKSKSNLAKLHPTDVSEDMLIAQSPKVTLLKDIQEDSDAPLIGKLNGRFSRAFVLSVPLQAEQARNRVLDYEHIKNKDGEVNQEKLELIGSVNEQCGPGQYRDGLGICRTDIK